MRSAARLRVCLLSQDYPPGPVGGIGRFTADLAPGLAGRGHDVHVVTRSPDGARRVEAEDGVVVHRVGIPGPPAALASSVLAGNLLHCAAVYHEVRRLHERHPLSLVVAPLWDSEGLLCVLDHRWPTLTWVQTTLRTVTDVVPSWRESPHVAGLLRLEAATIGASREVHAGSHASLALCREQFPGLTAHVRVVPHGLAEPAPATTATPTATERGAAKRVLFVGRLERRKGVDVLLAAADELLSRHPDAELVLVGADTPHTELGETYREAFARRHAGNQSLLNRVRFLGEVADDERDRWYESADVFCAPSRYESFGLVLLEAMARGVPVVSCNAGGIPEVVDGNGLLAEPGDERSLLTCLDRLLADAHLREEMGRRSRRLFVERWSLEPWVDRVEAMYEAVARDHRPEGGGVDVRRLADVLVEAGAVPEGDASVAAAQLVDPARFGDDDRAAPPVPRRDGRPVGALARFREVRHRIAGAVGARRRTS